MNRFITGAIPSVTNSSAASAARPTASATARPFIRIESRQHVIGQIPPGVAAPDADPQPCKLFGPQLLDERLQTVVTAGRAGSSCSQPSQLQLRLVDDDEEIRQVQLVVPQQLPDRVSTQVHERERLGHQDA